MRINAISGTEYTQAKANFRQNASFSAPNNKEITKEEGLAFKSYTYPQISFGRKTQEEKVFQADLKELKKFLKHSSNFSSDERKIILQYTNEENMQLAKVIACSSHTPFIRATNILDATNKDNLDLAMEMFCYDEFPESQIADILETTNEENVDARVEMLNFLKSNRAEMGGDYRTALWVIANINNENLDLTKDLMLHKEFDVYDVISIINKIDSVNKGFARAMIEDEEFPKQHIASILLNTNEDNVDTKIEAYDFIKRYKEHIGEDYKDCFACLSGIEPHNTHFAKTLILNGNFPKKEISNILIYSDKSSLNSKIDLYNFIEENKDNLEDNYHDAVLGIKYTTSNNLKTAKIIVNSGMCQDLETVLRKTME